MTRLIGAALLALAASGAPGAMPPEPAPVTGLPGGRLRIVWNAHDGADRWVAAFARFVEPGDWVLVVAGNADRTLDAAAARRDAAAVRRAVPAGAHVGVLTAGLDHVKALSRALAGDPDVEAIGYGYEPGYAPEFPVQGDAGWRFAAALRHVASAQRFAAAVGMRLIAIPTGRPLHEGGLRRHGWDYRRFLTDAKADWLLIQTQTWIRSNDFVEALDELDRQLGDDPALRARTWFQVAVEPDRIANENGVDPETALNAVYEARLRGYGTVSLWHAWRDLPAALDWVRRVGRDGPRAVPTFTCAGLYWSPPAGGVGVTCAVRYRDAGAAAWRAGLPLWFDGREGEYRGSLVGLAAGTAYDVALDLAAAPPVSATLTVATWPEGFPVGATVFVPAGIAERTLTVSVSGRPGAYVLYAPAPRTSATIDVAGREDFAAEVTASYVVVHGLALRGARKQGIELGPGVHDVVIEDCDISGWGRIAPDGFGVEHDAAIRGKWPDLTRIIVQRNRLHDPRGNANDWTQQRDLTGESYHPVGPQAVVFYDNEGNHVIRDNDVFADESHRFNDGLGGAENFSTRGYPGADSDVYGNRVRNVCDDAEEIEGGGRNVRVWGNYLDLTYTGVSSAACSLGPLYIFRNVMNRSRVASARDTDLDDRGWFGKLGDEGRYAHGRRYFLHNTLLQPRAPGRRDPLGALKGPHPCGGTETMSNTVSLNNLWHVCRHGQYVCDDHTRSPTNLLDYDLYDGRLKAYPGAEGHGFAVAPVFRPGHGDEAGDTGRYQLAPGSPGAGAAVPLPGFNDGPAPDVGAAQSGDPPMRFGPEAAASR